MIQTNYCKVNKILKKNKYGGIFGGKYSFSPYRACSHACKYCDGRYEKYNVAGNFEEEISVRENTAVLLAKEVAKIRERGTICISSGVSDAYQPLEAKEGIMGECAEILADHRLPVTVITKSALARRDIDLWQSVHRQAGFNLLVSLTMLDDKVREVFEPGASRVDERLAMLAAFKAKGMNTGVLAMPFLPFITDGEVGITRLFRALKDREVDFIWPESLTLKAGRQKEIFLDTIRTFYPHLLDKYRLAYAHNHWSGIPNERFCTNFYPMAHACLRNLGIPSRPPHYMYREQFPNYDSVFILLQDMCHLYNVKGKDTAAVLKAMQRLDEWFSPMKQYYARRRKLLYADLEKEFAFAFEKGVCEAVIDNQKLHSFLCEVILNDKVFDYVRLVLRNH